MSEIAGNICKSNCLGCKGNWGGCCTVDDRDWIMGPIKDSEEFLNKLKQKFPGMHITWSEVFYTYEEGSKLFPNKPNWQNPDCYPAFKLNLNDPRKPCIFYNTTLKMCTVYDVRPKTCRDFFCEFLKNSLKQI